MDLNSELYNTIFSCKFCNYQAQVVGEKYFDNGCYEFMATYRCLNCNTLQDYPVSEFKPFLNDKIIQEDFTSTNNIIELVPITAEEADELSIISSLGPPDTILKYVEIKPENCFLCGSDQLEIWTKENSICPKCGKTMHILT